MAPPQPRVTAVSVSLEICFRRTPYVAMAGRTQKHDANVLFIVPSCSHKATSKNLIRRAARHKQHKVYAGKYSLMIGKLLYLLSLSQTVIALFLAIITFTGTSRALPTRCNVSISVPCAGRLWGGRVRQSRHCYCEISRPVR